ncbi:hypothetical protein FLAG1_07367 [Fusarium langsethiae]|uniref:Uncharacterized protein n=1 Tax=Fusarium langsethiae TaxID=179993 RepID=A0A0M9EUI3_FUSLA|nr:hypothetical protein FLAG1_07367 [Fusarium langsethiae]GKU16176.1 unnamed protein product [Fusarium langsethiae]
MPQLPALHPGPPLGKFIYDAVFLAVKQNITSQGLSGLTRQNRLQALESEGGSAMNHLPNAAGGISREEAEALFSTFRSDIKHMIQEQSSKSLGAWEEKMASSNAGGTSDDASAQLLERTLLSIEEFIEVRILSAKLDFKAEAESFAENFKSGIAEEHAKHRSEMEALLHKHLSAMHAPPSRPDVGDNAPPVFEEIKGRPHELRQKGKSAELPISKRRYSQTSSVITRAQTKAAGRQRKRRKA